MKIHPDTPAEGILLSEKFAGANLDAMFNGLNQSGKPYQITFGALTLLTNSHLSLLASEFARDNGKFHDFHEKVFHSYFTECIDIGSLETILSLGEAVGLNREELLEAIESNRYESVLEQSLLEGQRYGRDRNPYIYY